MGNDLLSANPARNADDIRSDTVGVLAIAQVGRSLGKVADKVSDSAFLWCDALLRRVLCAVAFRHRALHTGREPDSHHSQRTDYGCLSAKQFLLCRLSDGGKHCCPEMPEPRTRLSGIDDS